MVSVLFNEPKLLKLCYRYDSHLSVRVSVLFNEPKLLKCDGNEHRRFLTRTVSVLFNEPKLLKFDLSDNLKRAADCFSALQRAEIAEIQLVLSPTERYDISFSALQRAEIAEI